MNKTAGQWGAAVGIKRPATTAPAQKTVKQAELPTVVPPVSTVGGKEQKTLETTAADNSGGVSLSDVFGAGATVVNKVDISKKVINLGLFQITTGVRGNTTISQIGDSTKPLSVSAVKRGDDPLLSSVKVGANAFNTELALNLGLDNIGISTSGKYEDLTTSTSVKLNLNEFKLGWETSETLKLDDNTSTTSYVNVSIDGKPILIAMEIAALVAYEFSFGAPPSRLPIFDYLSR